MYGSAPAVLTGNLSSSGSACGNSMAAPAPAPHLHSIWAKAQAKRLKEQHLCLKVKFSQIAPQSASHVPLVKSHHVASLSSKRHWEMTVLKKYVLEPVWKKRTIYFKESEHFQGSLVPICICSHETSVLRPCFLQDCRDL